MSDLTQERLKALVNYDPETGVFTWRIARSNCIKVGAVAGCVRRDGRRVLNIDYHLYLASRLAWLYVTGRWPENEIDHIDQDGGNDRWTNLREATRAENQANGARRTRALYRGVYYREDKAPRVWAARIKHQRKERYIGYFSTPEDAARAYDAKARELFGSFAKPNFP